MKELVNKIIHDLSNNKPISEILLKTQVVASKLGNKEFEEWIRNEQNGYPDATNIPDYRVVAVVVKACVSQPYTGFMKTITIPAGIYDEDIINDCMSHARIVQSLCEIESLCESKQDGVLQASCPAMAYAEVKKHVYWNVENVWQEISVHSLKGINYAFKSKLLAFFLELDKKMEAGLDFSQIGSQDEIKQIMNNTYYISSIVANTGDGTVNAGDISGNDVSQLISDENQKGKIKEIISRLEAEANKLDNADLQEAIETIKEECKKPNWVRKTLKMAFNAVHGIATSIAANQLTPIVTEALALI